MKPLSERIKDFDSEKFINWLCLSCVDVREVRSEEEAQEEINKIREAVTFRFSALEDKLRIKQNHIRLRDTYIEELEDRAESAEARLAELEKQEPIYQLMDDDTWYDAEPHIYHEITTQGYNGRIVYRRPAPAINLAEMVPDEMTFEYAIELCRERPGVIAKSFQEGANFILAAILRNIEEAK